MWPFSSERKRIEALDRVMRQKQEQAFEDRCKLKHQSQLKQLQEFAGLGESFVHCGVQMTVMSHVERKRVRYHSSDWGDYEKNSWRPRLCCHYVDQNGVIRKWDFSPEDLPSLIFERENNGRESCTSQPGKE